MPNYFIPTLRTPGVVRSPAPSLTAGPHGLQAANRATESAVRSINSVANTVVTLLGKERDKHVLADQNADGASYLLKSNDLYREYQERLNSTADPDEITILQNEYEQNVKDLPFARTAQGTPLIRYDAQRQKISREVTPQNINTIRDAALQRRAQVNRADTAAKSTQVISTGIEAYNLPAIRSGVDIQVEAGLLTPEQGDELYAEGVRKAVTTDLANRQALLETGDRESIATLLGVPEASLPVDYLTAGAQALEKQIDAYPGLEDPTRDTMKAGVRKSLRASETRLAAAGKAQRVAEAQNLKAARVDGVVKVDIAQLQVSPQYIEDSLKLLDPTLDPGTAANIATTYSPQRSADPDSAVYSQVLDFKHEIASYSPASDKDGSQLLKLYRKAFKFNGYAPELTRDIQRRLTGRDTLSPESEAMMKQEFYSAITPPLKKFSKGAKHLDSYKTSERTAARLNLVKNYPDAAAWVSTLDGEFNSFLDTNPTYAEAEEWLARHPLMRKLRDLKNKEEFRVQTLRLRDTRPYISYEDYYNVD